jgi:hypothetical protein
MRVIVRRSFHLGKDTEVLLRWYYAVVEREALDGAVPAAAGREEGRNTP